MPASVAAVPFRPTPPMVGYLFAPASPSPTAPGSPRRTTWTSATSAGASARNTAAVVAPGVRLLHRSGGRPRCAARSGSGARTRAAAARPPGRRGPARPQRDKHRTGGPDPDPTVTASVSSACRESPGSPGDLRIGPRRERRHAGRRRAGLVRLLREVRRGFGDLGGAARDWERCIELCDQLGDFDRRAVGGAVPGRAGRCGRGHGRRRPVREGRRKRGLADVTEPAATDLRRRLAALR